MSPVQDYTIMSARWLLDRKVSTYDAAGNLLPDDGAYQREGAEAVYTFCEFLRDRNLLQPGVDYTRSPDFELRASHLTETGMAFVRSDLDRWMRAKRRDLASLERRWEKFCEKREG